MAKTTLHCTTPDCTGTGVVVERNRREADRKAAWLQDRGWTCEACRAKARDTENAAAAERNQDAGLPALTGSEKQVAWAETIRAKAVPTIAAAKAAIAGGLGKTLADALGREPTPAERDEVEDALALLAREAASETQASVWIDARDRLWEHNLREQFAARAATLAPSVFAAVKAARS